MLTICQRNQLLQRTLNIGLHLGGANDDGWCIEVTDAVIASVTKAGFTAIRLGVQWAAHCQSAEPYTIKPDVFKKVDAALASARAHGLAVVVSNFLDPELMQDPAAYRARFLAITHQVAEHYRNEPESVMLELLAEPREKLDPLWNDYVAASLAMARKHDPDRAIVVGPSAYNNARKLAELRLPDGDRNLIVTVHHYWPLNFTMQGEAWFHLPWFMKLFLGDPKSWPGTTWEGTPRQQATQKRIIDSIARWGKDHDRPMFVGEFGASNMADMASRARLAGCIRELCEAQGLAWGFWSYGPSFALYDFEHKRWHEDLLRALTPDHR